MDKDLKIQQLEELLVLLVEQRHPEWLQEVTHEFSNELRESSDGLRRCRAENRSLQDTNAALFEAVSMLLKSECELTAEHTRLRAREEELGQELSSRDEAIHSLELRCQGNVERMIQVNQMEEKLAALEAHRDQLQLSLQHHERLNEVQPFFMSDEVPTYTFVMAEAMAMSQSCIEELQNKCSRLESENMAVARVLELENVVGQQATGIDKATTTSKSTQIALEDAEHRLKDLTHRVRNRECEISELHSSLEEQTRRAAAAKRNFENDIARLESALHNNERESNLLDQIALLNAELRRAKADRSSMSTLSSGSDVPSVEPGETHDQNPALVEEGAVAAGEPP
ncbi:hypothetical protein AURDEDRAFT_172201 [Auricularia subglabra TFB-10046 SS5]|nr:hypothetical protein AURDEDRAFT_172201 [Auricularia subglabra TFB-10046 SS5]